MDYDEDNYVWDNEKTDEGKTYDYQETDRDVLIVKVPKDYDGLTLAPYQIDIDYDEYVKAVKDKTNDSDKRVKVFDTKADGKQYTTDDIVFLRLKDYAVPANAENMSKLFSFKANHPYMDNFDWTDKVYDDPKFGGEVITDSEMINGKWEGYMIWDKENKLNNYLYLCHWRHI